MLSSFSRLNAYTIFCAKISLYIKIAKVSTEHDIKRNT